MGPAASWMTCSTSTGDRGIYGYIPAIPFHANSNFSTYLRLSAGGAEIYGIRYESVGVVRAWIGGYIDRTTDVAMQFQDRRLSHGGNVTDTWIVYNGPYSGGPGSVINSPSGESTKLTFLKWLSGGYGESGPTIYSTISWVCHLSDRGYFSNGHTNWEGWGLDAQVVRLSFRR